MKKFIGVFLSFFVASTAVADTCAKNLMPAFTSSQANALCNELSPGGDFTIGGELTATGLLFPAANYEAIAGAGTTVADAATLTAGKNIFRITGANGTVGWKFPTSVAGEFKILLNTTAGVAKIYAASGGTVNGGAADAAFTALTGIKPILCYSTAVDTWICS
jgi:hypothetical protein